MLTRTYRPRHLGEVVGQGINVEVLQSILNNPEESPRVLLFEGSSGTGKTTLAGILAWGLNCVQPKNKPCGKCEVCVQIDAPAPYHQEFDASAVGTKEQIMELQEWLLVPVVGYPWQVVTFDEFHLASRAAQSVLLKSLEALPRETFVIFCTTDVTKIIPPLKSRALQLTFHSVPSSEVKVNLFRVAAAEGMVLPEALAEKICRHARGNVRNSIMLLDLYKTLGGDPEKFSQHLQSSERSILRVLCAIKMGMKDEVQSGIHQILRFPLVTLHQDFHRVLHEALKLFATNEAPESYKKEYQGLVELYRGDLLRLFSMTMSEWGIHSFEDDQTLQAFIWTLFVTFGREKAPQGKTPVQKAAQFRKKVTQEGAPDGAAQQA